MSSEELAELVSRHRSQGVLIDSNLLLLLLVGLCDIDWISGFKRTQQYRSLDFDILHRLVSRFERIVTSPNVATEVNGLANQLRDNWRRVFAAEFKRRIAVMEERYIGSTAASSEEHFPEFGLTDAVSLRAAREGYLVLTDDAPLYHLLEGLGLP